MSQANVEIVRQGYEAFATGDLDWVARMLEPDFVHEQSDALPGAGTFFGAGGLRKAVEGEREVQEGWTLEPREFIPAGDDVVVLIVQRATARFSGVDMTRPLAHVWTLRNGRGVRMRAFSSWERALEAVGLDPGAAR